ncbi:AraC family transcriptional regulator [Saccharicrinis fermentans]|uniref:Chb operon repressor n=1 Tax=Saccharicrinis fermentans DSM 9555 = JCM 21142 TaxID=869213 RepID=W7YM59_9BACT|nr:helix-turn-helix transcriptional regulator [Saccharicrinis fermentans]GAF03484.1 chb operon repressor [Saccharicrinis fermentans DSM 9555 = JCM 21142]
MSDAIKKYPFKDGLNHEFEILDLSSILSVKNELMTVPHRAQFYHILWIEKGKGTHYVDFKPVDLEDNMIIFVPNNCVNLFDKKGAYQGKVIIFTDSFFSKNNHDMLFLHSSILFSDWYDIVTIKLNSNPSELHLCIDFMEKEFKRSADAAQYYILHNMLYVFLLQAEREMRKQGFKEQKPSFHLDCVVLFKDLLEQNFKKDRSVKNYAAALNISDKQLHKATTTLLDKTPKQIIDERVILEAKRLLVHSHQSIKEITFALGYDEPTNFVKYFRKHTDLTPSEFRQKQLDH